MSSDFPQLWLARHGDTAWTDSHQHTGRTDLRADRRFLSGNGRACMKVAGSQMTTCRHRDETARGWTALVTRLLKDSCSGHGNRSSQTIAEHREVPQELAHIR